MPPPPKGKQPTKGAKQILMENAATLNFYRNMSLGAAALYIGLSAVFFYEEVTGLAVLLNIFVISIYAGCHQAMRYISRPRFSDQNHLIDAGLDLNMEGGMGEHVKDIVILSSITHVLAITSNYFWLLLLLLPLRIIWLLWVNVLGPWFFQPGPDDTEQDEKKRKKLERKMKRYQQ